MSTSIESLFGDRERPLRAAPESWRAVEEWLGHGLPADYKELVDGYGDAVLFRHLFVPHPQGSDPLLSFVQGERREFHASYQGTRNIPESVMSAWERIIPWAYHDWNGDVCLLVPDLTCEKWNVAVAFRQCPSFPFD